jgi:hypothetical protein
MKDEISIEIPWLYLNEWIYVRGSLDFVTHNLNMYLFIIYQNLIIIIIEP